MYITAEQKIVASICHLGGLLMAMPILVPLVVFLVTTDSFMRVQAKEALFFQIGLVIAGVAVSILMLLLVGFLLVPVLAVIGLILPVIATINIWKQRDYSYPITGKYARLP